MAYTQEAGGIRPGAFAEIKKVADFVKGGGKLGSKKDKTSGKPMQGRTNEYQYATEATYGPLPKSYKGLAKDKNNKIVNFSNNNQDFRRKEEFRLLPNSK